MIKKLRAANEKQKQKRTRSRRQIPSEEDLSEAFSLIAQPEQAVLAPIPREAGPAHEPSQPRTRALPTCSVCGIKGYKLTACPNRTRFSYWILWCFG
jgi:hypothetical protein